MADFSDVSTMFPKKTFRANVMISERSCRDAPRSRKLDRTADKEDSRCRRS